MTNRFFLAGLLLATTACSGPIETRIASSGAALPSTTGVALAEPDQRLTEALLTAGYAIDPNGAVLIDLGVSERPATMGIADQSAPRKRAFLQSCRYRTYRVTLSAVDRRTGAILARASAEEHHCRAPLADVAPHLLRQAAAALQADAGERRLTRDGVN